MAVTRQFVNEHAREIKITIEGPNSLSENTLTEMEARHLRDALDEALPPDGQTDDEDEADEAYEIGKRDGYEDAIQDLDIATGGDGEFAYVMGDHSDPRHCPDVDAMKRRILARFNRDS